MSAHFQKIILKLASTLGIVSLIFMTTSPALGGISIPSASSWASELEQRYNLDLEAIRDQGQGFNVSGQKTAGPQVSLYFNPTDPKIGQKVTALAFPLYFGNNGDGLYYTWYLKRAGCNLGDVGNKDECDLDGDDQITVEDWKIEAMRTYASNEFDSSDVDKDGSGNYASDDDNDGYKAIMGGAGQANVDNNCFYHDNASGENYQIVRNAGDLEFDDCSSGNAVCLELNGEVLPGTVEATAGGGTGGSGGVCTDPGDPSTCTGGSGGSGGSGSASAETFTINNTTYSVTGLATCQGEIATCYKGTPVCVSNPNGATSYLNTLSTCSVSSENDTRPYCRHLFPNAPGNTTGNASFGKTEEEFWVTDPHDPSTSDNGNKDEANVAGLGAQKLTWNYLAGDLVGVVVEGTSMIPTKEDNSSSMIMWAFSKNDCPVSVADGTGSYQQTIRGYAVTIPTIEIDLNDCIERNLVDPTLGGQATKLEISLSSSPENPQNGPDGDTLEISSSVDNAARASDGTRYDWTVELSPNGSPNPPTWLNITNRLNNFSGGRKLLSATSGNNVDSLRMTLNLEDSDVLGAGGTTFQNILNASDDGSGYLRFRLEARENFASGANRVGRSSVLVKFFSSEEKIQAYTVNTSAKTTASPAVKVALGTEICDGRESTAFTPAEQAKSILDAKLCQVVPNEIIGLRVNNDSQQYSNFNWTINGKPLICNSQVSNSCPDDHQDHINFFPVMGEPGDLYTITVTANKIETAADNSSDKSITLSRSFKVVSPSAQIVPANTDVRPKILGQYVDAEGKAFADESRNTLEAIAGAAVSLKAEYNPTFLELIGMPRVERAWTVDDQAVGDGTTGWKPNTTTPQNPLSFMADKPEGSIYNVSLAVVYRPSVLTRTALQDIWGISILDSTEEYFGATTQIELPISSDVGKLTGPKRYLALLGSYLPESLLFSLRVLLSIGIILFVSGLIFSLTPQPSRMRE